MKKSRYCVIMAGGVGSRFWPRSRQSCPKQFLDVMGIGKSFLRLTYERFLALVDVGNFIVVTNARYKSLVLEHIPELNESQILCEPIGRNTAPCVAYAAYSIASKDPDAEMIVTPSDHYILGEEHFLEAINTSLSFLEHNEALMTIGIPPLRPETSYGYIQVSDKESISPVKCFTEKPNAELAKTFLQCGEFVWNSGMFLWSVRSIIKAFSIYMPEMHSLFSSITTLYGTPNEAAAVERVFFESKSISIDYAIMEKADNVYVKIGEFSWCDIGTWGSLVDYTNCDELGNVTPKNSCLYNTSNTIISTPEDKLVVISGLEDYLVVDTDDVLMVCPRSEEQNIKSFIEDIKYKIGEEYL